MILVICSCNKGYNYDNYISDEEFLTGKKYTAIIKNFDSNKTYFLQIDKSTILPFASECDVVEFKKKSNHLEAEFVFKDSDYMAHFAITDGEERLDEFPKLMKLIFNSDSSYKEYTYYPSLMESSKENYLDLFYRSLAHYPDNIGIFLTRWQFEGNNKLNNRDSLLQQITYLINNHSTNPDIHYVLSVAYSLLGDDKRVENELQKLSETECRLFNNQFTAGIFNDVFNTGFQTNLEQNENADIIRNIILKNLKSYYAVRNLSSPFKSKYDSLNIPLYYELLNEKHYFYLDVFISLFSKTIYNFLPDSIETADRIEYEFENIYKNRLELYKSGLNSYFIKLPTIQIFNENRYHKNMKMKRFDNAISICRENIKSSLENKSLSSINTEYLRIAYIYENELSQPDSALSNYIQSLMVKRKDKETNKELLRFWKKNTDQSVEFDKWLDSVENRFKTQYLAFQSQIESSKNKVKFADGKEVNLNFPERNTVLVFYSFTCAPCKYIFENMKVSRQKVYNSNVQFIYICNDENEKIDILENKYRIGLQKLSNSKELFGIYDVKAVPKIVCIDKTGNIVNVQDGAGLHWDVEDMLAFF